MTIALPGTRLIHAPGTVHQPLTQLVPTEWMSALFADPRRRARLGRLALVATLLAATTVVGVRALAGPGEASSGSAPPAAATVARVATAALPLIDVYREPEGDVLTTLEHPTVNGTPLVFEVTSEWEGWLRVRLPSPGQPDSGWLLAEHVTVSEVDVHVTIDKAAHRVVVREGGEVVLDVPISVGRYDAPAAGTYFVTEVLELANPNTRYGTHVLGLSGHANGPDRLFRADDIVGLHGTADPARIGELTREGSIALTDRDIANLAALVPAGTPVQVVGGAGASGAPDAAAPVGP